MIENAEITSTMLGNEDRGIFTCYVAVSGDGWGGSFGGFALDQYLSGEGRRVGTAYGMEFIKAILETLEVGTWEKLPGTPVRVESEGLAGRISRIGHFKKNKWFDPRLLLEKIRESA